MAQATRMAFISKDNKLYFKYYTFEYFSGFAISQKRKTIEAFHKVIREDGINNVLEVSRKNENEIGAKLSAFNLMVSVENKSYPVECIYQASKVFNDIQYKECQYMEAKDAKRYVKEQIDSNKLSLTSFKFGDKVFSNYPKSLFYDYLYILALSQNKELALEIINYDCFTDIEFNHKKQFASQARSCALYKYLYENNQIEMFLNKPLLFENLYYLLG